MNSRQDRHLGPCGLLGDALAEAAASPATWTFMPRSIMFTISVACACSSPPMLPKDSNGWPFFMKNAVMMVMNGRLCGAITSGDLGLRLKNDPRSFIGNP